MSGAYKQWNDIDIPDDFVLPEGSVLRGQLLFKKYCAQCHTIRRDGANPYGTLLGPNLYGVMGRTAAQNQRTGWASYSTSLQESGILWTERNMMAFLKNPRAFAGGVINMNFRGVDRFQDRVDLVHYMKRAGHESWMVNDGTPHSQKGWWNRGKNEGQYRTVYRDEKQIKPWQHLMHMASEKAKSAYDGAALSLGFESSSTSAASDASTASSSSSGGMEEDPDVKRWREVSQVVNGVKTATMQQSFNWPPPEVVAAGPVKEEPRPSSGSRRRRRRGDAEAPPSALAPPAPPPASERPRPTTGPDAGGDLAPSGLVVFRIGAGPPAAPPLPPRGLSAPELAAAAAEAAAGGGELAPSGLVVFTVASSAPPSPSPPSPPPSASPLRRPAVATAAASSAVESGAAGGLALAA